MAKWGRCDFKQMRDLQERVKKLAGNHFEAFCEECAEELAQRLLAKVTKRTPVGVYPPLYAEPVKGYEPAQKGGELRRSWDIASIIKTGNVYEIIVYNSKFYASYVEFGHRQEPGRFVPQIGLKLKKSWVKGRFMLTISEQELQSQSPKIIQNKLKKYLVENFNG